MTVYVEGGGDGRSLRMRFREGWRQFLERAPGVGRVKIVRGGGREQTFRRFADAVTDAGRRAAVLLLVDSEGPVAEGHTVWGLGLPGRAKKSTKGCAGTAATCRYVEYGTQER